MREKWVVVTDDGALLLHSENQGIAFLDHGAEALEEPVTLDELKKYRKTLDLGDKITSWTLYDEALTELGKKGFCVQNGNIQRSYTLTGHYMGAWIQAKCHDEKQVIQLITSMHLDNPLLFDPCRETRFLMFHLDKEHKLKEPLPKEFYNYRN